MYICICIYIYTRIHTRVHSTSKSIPSRPARSRAGSHYGSAPHRGDGIPRPRSSDWRAPRVFGRILPQFLGVSQRGGMENKMDHGET